MRRRLGYRFKKFLLKGKKLPLIAFIFMIILVGGFSFQISTDVYKVSEVIHEFYEHPYNVRNAVHDFQIQTNEIANIWSGHNGDKYLTSNIESVIKQKYELLDTTYSIIENQYLGPKVDAKALLDSYESLKNNIQSKGYDAGILNHEESFHDEVNILLSDIAINLKPIEYYAINKADEFRITSVIEEASLLDSLKQFYTVIILFFVLSAIFVGYVISNKDGFIFSEKEKFNKSIEDAPIPIMIHKNGNVIQLSKEWNKLSGYTIKDIPTIEEWSRKAYGEKHIPSKEFIMNLYKLEKTQDDGIWKIKTKSGEERLWRFYSSPLGNNTVNSTAVDVTEEVKREELIQKLNKETQKLAKAVDQSPVSIVITDTKGNIEYVNDYFEKITGYTSEEAIGANPRILKSGVQDKKVYENLWQTIANGKTWRGELQNKAKDGTLYWESVSISPIFNESGDVNSYVAVKENITDRILSEQELTLSNNNLIKAQKIGQIGNWVFDCISKKIEWSDQLFEIYNRDIELGSPTFKEFQSYHLKSEESFCSLLKALENGKAYDEDIKLITKQGQKKFIRTVGVPEHDNEGALLRYTGVTQDITYSKTIELELIESEQRLKGITDNLDGMIQRYVQYEDGSNAITYISKGIERLHGFTQEQVMEDSSILWDQIVEEDVDRVVNSVQKSAKELSHWDCRWRVKTSDGSLKWVYGKGFPRKDKENKCITWDSILMDITKEVTYEATLKKTNVQLQAAQDIARIGYWSFDVADGEVYLSPIVREIHEMDKNVNVNEGVNYYKEGYDRERIEFVLNEAIEKGIPYKEELKIITEKGNERWVRTNGMPIMKDGKCVQVSGTFMDITDEKEREQILKNSLEEKEVLLSEVHHRVKNNLAVISGMLELQAFSSKNKKEIEELAKSVYRIKAIAIIHEQLYKTGNFASISIDESIVTQTESLVKMYDGKGKKIEILYDLDNITLNVNQAIPFGLLLNELLTNSLKYAFEGIQKPELKLSLQMLSESIQFTFQDNGIGFDVSKFKNSEETLGRSLIEAFIAQLEGNLDIKSGSKGTIITLSFRPTKKKGASANYEIKGS